MVPSPSAGLEQRHKAPIFNQLCLLNEDRGLPHPRLADYKLRLLLASGRFQIVHSSARSQSIVAEFEDFPGGGRPRREAASGDRRTAAQLLVRSIERLCAGEELLSPLHYKIRFFILQQMEDQFRRCALLQPNRRSRFRNVHPDLMDTFQLVPFGSEVSGFGNADSDMDFCLVQQRDLVNSRGQLILDDRRHKEVKSKSLRVLHSVGAILESSIKLTSRGTHPEFYPRNFTNLKRIFRAFVPIIKCRSRLLPTVNIDVSVDLDVSSGVEMAAYLHHCA